jgi:hypothetical protein
LSSCIYLNKTETNLNYTKREHVIPAGLGGINKLPLGSVSDEINETFSRIERIALQKSFVSINREKFGPGKRGSLNINKVSNPLIMLMREGENTNEIFRLGFLFAGESYLIPQIYLDFNDEEGYISTSYYSTVFDVEEGEQILSAFKSQFIAFLSNQNRDYILIEMPFTTDKHFICIGCFKGKWFAATSHKIINMDYMAMDLLPELVKETVNEPIVQPKALFKYERALQMDSSFAFIYAKTAFNSLAFLMGSDFVKDEVFDDVRNAIKDQMNLDMILIDRREFYSLIDGIVSKVPSKSHFVIVTTFESMVLAFVSFYKEPPGIIKLANEYTGQTFTKGIICDWQNRNEYFV